MRTKSIDFDAVKRMIGIVETYRSLQMLCVRRPLSPDYRARCPVCARSAQSQTVSVRGMEWYCHRCKVGGDVIRLAELVFDLDPWAAALKLCELVECAVPYRTRASFRRPRKKRNGEEAR